MAKHLSKGAKYTASVKNNQSMTQQARLATTRRKGEDLRRRLGTTQLRPVKIFAGNEQLYTQMNGHTAGVKLDAASNAYVINHRNATGKLPDVSRRS